MATSKCYKHEEYELYEKHCLKIAAIAPDQKSRIIQREMPAEWLNLADAISLQPIK
jgi:hypothetical protein